jgi:hypothetical protein
MRHPVQHLVRRNIIQNLRDRLRGVETVGDRDEIGLRHNGELAVSAVHQKRRYLLAHMKIDDTGSNGVNFSHYVITRHERKWWLTRVHPKTHEHIGEGYTDGQDLYPHFRWARKRQFLFDECEDFRSTLAGDDDARIFLWRHREQPSYQRRNRPRTTNDAVLAHDSCQWRRRRCIQALGHATSEKSLASGKYRVTHSFGH